MYRKYIWERSYTARSEKSQELGMSIDMIFCEALHMHPETIPLINVEL